MDGMKSTVNEHYANHLGPIYAWMVGDFETACTVNQQFFDSIGLEPKDGAVAVDLGCGHGLQSIPLLNRGFDVIAIDSSKLLLDQLEANVLDLQKSRSQREVRQLTAVQDDLLNFPAALSAGSAADAIICMGDTITHLKSQDDVKALIQKAAKHLSPQGTLCLSFRDYTAHELTDTSRFIPVRSDDNRIHVCFLDYQPHTVDVYDLIHSRTDEGWKMTTSGYAKLRLSPETLVDWAKDSGFSISHRSESRGMLYFAFMRDG